MTRLKAYVSNPVVKLSDPDLPHIALEHIEPGVGRLISGAVLEGKDADDTVEHQPGDVRFGKLRPYLAKSVFMEARGTGSGELLVLRAKPGMNPRFLWYTTLSERFIDWAVATSYGVKMPRTSWRHLSDFDVELPSLEAQARAVRFLDAELATVDDLIQEQQRFADLLIERRTAALLSLVTCGPAQGHTTPRQELGGIEATASWDVRPLRSLPVLIQTGPFGSQLHQSDYIEGGHPVVNPMNLVDGRIRPTDTMTVDDGTRARLSRHVLREGDVVFARRGEMGRAGLVGPEEVGWLCGTGSLLLRFKEPVFEVGYLKRYLETSLIKQYLQATSVGATMDNLNTQIVGRIPMLVPPQEAQREISVAADALDNHTRQLLAELNISRSLAAERRTALISAVVTGQLEVA